MSKNTAIRAIGKWDVRNNEFQLSRAPIGCCGRGGLILKLYRKSDSLGIGFWVDQDKEAMRARLQKEFASWKPNGMQIAFQGIADHNSDKGFALYANIAGMSPRQLEDGMPNLEKDLERVKGYIREVALKLRCVATFHGPWEQ